MSIGETSAPRTLHDLSHLIFSSGKLGRLQTLSVVPVIAGDSFEQNLVGSLRLSPMRRGLAVDSVVDVFSFYVPHRHIYGEEWIEFLKEGVSSDDISVSEPVSASNTGKLNFIGINCQDGSNRRSVPKWLYEGYLNIHSNYFKIPWTDGWEGVSLNDVVTDGLLDGDYGIYGLPCAQLKTIWSTVLPPERSDGEVTIPVSGAEGTIDLMDLNAQYGALHTEQERQLFMQRYRDVVKKGFGGSTHYDADNRPKLMMRNTFWASGYDVDGTAESTLGQFAGRVLQSFNHKVPRFFVPEHGAVWTVALVRFPATHSLENHYLYNKSLPSYEEIAGDPAIVGNVPPVVVNSGDLFDESTVGLELGKIAHSQWYRTHPSTVHRNYADLQGFPFLEAIPSALNSQLYIVTSQYDSMFQTTQLGHWNMQARNNVNVMRTLPTARDSAVTNN